MGLFSKKRPSTKLTNEQQAQLKRNRSLLDEEIEESEKRLKAISRGRLGYASLLTGQAKPAQTKASPSLIKPNIGEPGE